MRVCCMFVLGVLGVLGVCSQCVVCCVERMRGECIVNVW